MSSHNSPENGREDDRGERPIAWSRRKTLGGIGLASVGLMAGSGTAGADGRTSSGQDGNEPWYRWENDVDAGGHVLRELGALELDATGTSITDFEGDHLEVDEGGVLHADETSYVAFHDLDDYGADPDDPDHYDDDAFDAAVDAAGEGDWIVMTNGTYTFGDRHVMEKSLTVYGEGSTILSDTHDERAYPNDQSEHYYPLFAFRGSHGDGVTSLSGPVDEGDHRLVVGDVSGFEVGSGVVVRNLDGQPGEYGTAREPARVMGRSYRPSVSVVREIDEDENAIYLSDALKYDYEEGHNVQELDQLLRPTFLRLDVRNKEPLAFDDEKGKVMGGFRHAFATEYCREARVIECRVSGYDSNIWTPLDDLDSISVDCVAENPMNLSGSCAEPFTIHGSTDITLVRPVIKECRRGPDLRSGCKTLTVIEPTITEVSLHGISYHHGSGEVVAGDYRVVGGKVHCKPTDPTMDNHGGGPDRRWEFQFSRGFLATGEGRLEMHGVDFLVRERGGRIYHEGSDVHIEGCTFRKVPRGATEAPLLDVSGENVANVHVRDTKFYGADRNDGEGTPGQAIRIQGDWDGSTDDYTGVEGSPDEDGRVRNVYVDAEIVGSFGETAVSVTDARDATFDVDVRQEEYWDADAAASNPAVTIGRNCSRIEITGTQRARGPGVVVDGENNKGIHVHDFGHQGLEAAFAIGSGVSDGDLVDLRLVDVSARGEDRVLDMNDTLVDGLHVVNFVGEDVRNFDEAAQENYAFTHLSGNNTNA